MKKIKIYMDTIPLLKRANNNIPRSEGEVELMIIKAAKHYKQFLKAMGFDPDADPQTKDTPTRVASSWLKDLVKGSVTEEPKITVFPNEEKFDGLVVQTGIRTISLCAHHNLPFTGYTSIAYVPGKYVIGLSKLNRVVDWFASRPQMQESLTQQIHNFLSEKLKCNSVAVSVSCRHSCCGNRGIKHHESTMTTNKFSGVFMEPTNLVRDEFLHAIMKNGKDF